MNWKSWTCYCPFSWEFWVSAHQIEILVLFCFAFLLVNLRFTSVSFFLEIPQLALILSICFLRRYFGSCSGAHFCCIIGFGIIICSIYFAVYCSAVNWNILLLYKSSVWLMLTNPTGIYCSQYSKDLKLNSSKDKNLSFKSQTRKIQQ